MDNARHPVSPAGAQGSTSPARSARPMPSRTTTEALPKNFSTAKPPATARYARQPALACPSFNRSPGRTRWLRHGASGSPLMAKGMAAPVTALPLPVVRLSYHGGNHYNSVVPLDEDAAETESQGSAE